MTDELILLCLSFGITIIYQLNDLYTVET